MKDETKDKVCTCAWYLPDIALKSFLNKDPEEDVTVYTQENKRKLFLQWKENNYEELENSLEYGSLLLRFFVDGLKAGKTKAFDFQRYNAWPEHDTIECSAMPW